MFVELQDQNMRKEQIILMTMFSKGRQNNASESLDKNTSVLF